MTVMSGSSPRPRPQPHYFAHPNFAVVLGFAGIIGIAIPMIDHHYALLGFLMCWCSALAICVLYFPEWKFGFRKFRKQEGYVKVADRRPIAKDALISPIFVVAYFVAPILVYWNPTLPTEFELATQWGAVGANYYIPGDIASYHGARSSQIVANGELIRLIVDHNYKLVGVCFHHSHSGDVQDEPNVSRSGPYDLESRQIHILVPWNDTFLKELVVSGMSPTGYELLAIPANQSNTKFSTIREAVLLGAKRLARRTGPP